MTTEQIIAEIDIEIERLKQVRALLAPGARKHGSQSVLKRHKLSLAARKKIADAQRKRWAKKRVATSAK